MMKAYLKTRSRFSNVWCRCTLCAAVVLPSGLRPSLNVNKKLKYDSGFIMFLSFSDVRFRTSLPVLICSMVRGPGYLDRYYVVFITTTNNMFFISLSTRRLSQKHAGEFYCFSLQRPYLPGRISVKYRIF